MISEGHFVCCVVFLLCSDIESFAFLQSQFRNPPISPSEFLSCTVLWPKKQNAGMLTSNAHSSSLTLSHALEQVQAARKRVIYKSASIAPHFLLARLQRYSFQFVFQLVLQLAALSVSFWLLSKHSVRTSQEFSLEQVGISPTYQVT